MSNVTNLRETIRRLCGIDALSPNAIAEILGCRAYLLDADEIQTVYEFRGGPANAWDRAELRWCERESTGFLLVTLPEGTSIPVDEVAAAFDAMSPPALINPDPRMPEDLWIEAYKVRVGELRLCFRDPEQDYVLRSFSVDQSPLVDWSDILKSPPPLRPEDVGPDS